MNGRLIGEKEDPSVVVRNFARDLAEAENLYAVQIGDTEWHLVQHFDILWTTEEGNEILIRLNKENHVQV